MTLEQELVRAEAQSLVAEAQLTNVTRQKFKEAYDLHTAAIIERAEKQIMLAQHARELLQLLDDTPIVPGEERPTFDHGEQAREVLNDAEQNLRSWTSSVQRIPSSAAGIGANAMPTQIAEQHAEQLAQESVHGQHITSGAAGSETGLSPSVLQARQTPYPTEDAQLA